MTSVTISTVTGYRARVRAELTDEIKRLAREQLAAEGAAALSLRAIARELGMVSSAVYRYFPSRDDLMTALIIDAYEALGEAGELADATRSRADVIGRWRAVTQAAWQWSRSNAAEYGLIFGTPVPGYEAPPDTIGPATRYSAVLLGILVDLHDARHVPPPASIPRPITRELAALRARTGLDASDQLLFAGISAWVSVFGAITFLRFGHLHSVIDDQERWFAAHVDQLAKQLLGIEA